MPFTRSKKVAEGALFGPCKWDSDGSLEVLVQWLRVPGNYNRWQQENQNQEELCDESLVLFNEYGISHRSAGAVTAKVRLTEQRFRDVKIWLTEAGVFNAYQIGEVDAELRASINKMCPAYDEIAPIFRHAVPHDEVVEILEDPDNDSGVEHGLQGVAEQQNAQSQDRGDEKKMEVWSIEDEERSQLFGCEHSAKMVQADVDIVCAKVLGRQKLLDAGISTELVDRVLPLDFGRCKCVQYVLMYM